MQSRLVDQCEKSSNGAGPMLWKCWGFCISGFKAAATGGRSCWEIQQAVRRYEAVFPDPVPPEIDSIQPRMLLNVKANRQFSCRRELRVHYKRDRSVGRKLP